MSTRQRKPEDETWFVHAPLKKEKRAIISAPPPSNIPYLNGVMDTEEELNKRPTMWFRATDSDFVRLSKLGGREDLLVHRPKVPATGDSTRNKPAPVEYPVVAWWRDMIQVDEQNKNDANKKYVFEVPAWFAHQEKKTTSESDVGTNCIDIPYLDAVARKSNNYAPIDEPSKYGQLRNYLNPVRVKHIDGRNQPSRIESTQLAPSET